MQAATASIDLTTTAPLTVKLRGPTQCSELAALKEVLTDLLSSLSNA